MIYIGRWQTIIVIGILLFGFLFAFPNFVPDRVRGVMPSATRVRISAALFGGRGRTNFFTTIP